MRLKPFFALIMSGFFYVLVSLPASAEVNITQAWLRLLPPMSNMTAAYMNIQSDLNDRLLSASSNIANIVEIHQSTMNNGVMSMREVEGLSLPKDTIVKLEPKSYHLMVMGLVEPLKASESYNFILEFEKAGKVEINIPTRNP